MTHTKDPAEPALDPSSDPTPRQAVIRKCISALEALAGSDLTDLPVSSEDLDDLALPHGLYLSSVEVDDDLADFHVEEIMDPDRQIGHCILPTVTLHLTGDGIDPFDANELQERSLLISHSGDLFDSAGVHVEVGPIVVEARFGAHVQDDGQYPEVELEGLELIDPSPSRQSDHACPQDH